jgi:sugar/nucleoside kinase (ribokinase family)
VAITVVGSVAYDTIETPAGRRERCLGGAATYFSLSASFFCDVRVIAVVGEDFGPEQEAVFRARGIDTKGIEHTAGKSFFWEGSYLENLNEAKTHNTELNVFAAFNPQIPDAYRDSEFLFLANIDPVLQRRVREQMPDVKLVAGDTMNYWIKDHRAALTEVLKGLDVLLINDTEARMLAGNNNLVQAARAVSTEPRCFMLRAQREEQQAARFARRLCLSRKSWIRLVRATALPAASSAIWHRRRS